MMREHYIIFFVIFVLAGCSPNPPSDSEVRQWFVKNEKSLVELMEIGTQHKALQRIEPSLKEYTDYYISPSLEALKAEKRVYEILGELKIDYVAYWRSPLDEDMPFMTVPYYRWGLSLGGYSKSIVFDPVGNSSKLDIHGKRYIYLDKKGWFIEVSDTR